MLYLVPLQCNTASQNLGGFVMPIVWTMGERKIGPRERVPVTFINVKPYHIIMLNKAILCDEKSGVPVVYDTLDLAELGVQLRRLTDYVIQKLELEELAHICRDRATPFDKVMLINDPSQLYVY